MEEKKKFDKNKYDNEYKKKNYRLIAFRVSKKHQDILDHFDKQENKAAYIINLIRKDMEK